MLTFDFEKSKLDWQYIQMWYESLENECEFILRKLKLVEIGKIVKKLKCRFYGLKSQSLTLTEWQFCSCTKVSGKILYKFFNKTDWP